MTETNDKQRGDDLKTVLDAATTYADSDRNWKGPAGEAYFKSRLDQAENRTKLRQAIERLRSEIGQ